MQEALQGFVEAEHFSNMLMPTINRQPGTLKESQFKQFIKEDTLYKLLYSEDTQTISMESSIEISNHQELFSNKDTDAKGEEKKSKEKQSPTKKPVKPTSLMLVSGSYDSRFEKLNLREKGRRKVY